MTPTRREIVKIDKRWKKSKKMQKLYIKKSDFGNAARERDVERKMFDLLQVKLDRFYLKREILFEKSYNNSIEELMTTYNRVGLLKLIHTIIRK